MKASEKTKAAQELRRINKELKNRNYVDVDFLDGLIANRAMLIKIHNLQSHWRC